MQSVHSRHLHSDCFIMPSTQTDRLSRPVWQNSIINCTVYQSVSAFILRIPLKLSNWCHEEEEKSSSQSHG